jgi:hypothetical protein
MKHAEIYNPALLMELIRKIGFLPLLDSGVFGYSAEEKEKVVFLQRSRSRSILAAENIAKDGDAPATNGQITVVI